MALKLKTAPAAKPVTVAQVKANSRIDAVDDDALLELLIDAAISHLDGYTGVLGRCMISQTWELYYDEFPREALKIPLGDIQSVTSVEYADPVTGLFVTWDAANYETDLISQPGWIIPTYDWPDHMVSPNAVRVTFVAGFGDAAEDVPAGIRQAMLMLVEHWYGNRGATGQPDKTAPLPFAVDALLAPWRRVGP